MKKERIGKIALIEYGPGKWKIDYYDPHQDGERVRLRLDAATYPEAIADAEKHNRYFRGESNIRPDKEREAVHAVKLATKTATALPVSDAMTAAESNLGYRESSLKNYRNDAKHFQTYLKDKHSVSQWADILPSMVVAYLKHMMTGGLSRNRARLCLLPVRITSEHCYADNPDHFRDVFNIKRKEIKRLMKPVHWPAKAESVALTDKEAHAFLKFLRENHPLLYPQARMILATGLRIYECAWVRACDIDRKAMTITPNDTEHHKLKTGKSNQAVPLLPWALEAVASWPVDGKQPLFTNLGGNPWGVDHLTRSWWLACDEARKAGIVPQGFTSKSMRATFATNLARMGISELLIQRAMRQAPDSVLSESYTKINIKDLNKLWATFGQLAIFKKYKPSKINALKAV